jgi:hypothetical protein
MLARARLMALITALHVPRFRRARERPLAGLDGDRKLARPPRGLGEQLQPSRSQGLLRVRRRQAVKRRPPFMTIQRRSRRVEELGSRSVGCLGQSVLREFASF